MDATSRQEILSRFKQLARIKVFIRTIYAPHINNAAMVRTWHKLITATAQGELYIARVNFLHELPQVLSCRECSLAEPPHEIKEDEMLWDFMSRHAGYSDTNSVDPLLVQMDVYSVSKSGERDRTNLNFLVDLMEARSLLIEHAGKIANAESGHPHVRISMLFADRLEGFLEEKLRVMNALIKGFNSIHISVS